MKVICCLEVPSDFARRSLLGIETLQSDSTEVGMLKIATFGARMVGK